MIETLRLHNFKAFRDTGNIDLKPITVLAGANSSGKTSILQSLLLLKQTLETESPDVDLSLDGRFLQLSGLSELTFGKPTLSQCKVDYEIGFKTLMPRSLISEYFEDIPHSDDGRKPMLRSTLHLSFRYKNDGANKRVMLNTFALTTDLDGRYGPKLYFSFYNKRYPVKMEGKGIELPEAYENRRIIDVHKKHFIPNLYMLDDDNSREHHYHPILPLDPIFLFPLGNLENALRGELQYLGPLREEPRRAYLHSGNPFPEIGQKGEYAAQILWLEKDKNVRYLPEIGQEIGQVTLKDAVSDVFRRLGIAQQIDVRSEKSIMYQILFGLKGMKTKKKVTIADVGFGVSQLLPIVIMGIRSPESSLLLFEQPEIHLHPRLQANLADFFLTLALSGKRLVIETHSDHFINRLRRRIAEDQTDELKDKVSILFVRGSRDDSGAKIEPLKMDRYGVIENWPPDFLPESGDEAEAIFRAGLEKRRGI